MASVVRLSEETIDDLQVDDQVAVLSLAWALRRQVNSRFLLSATVELCSPEELPNFDDALQRQELSDRYFLFFRRYSLSGPAALAWFRACAAATVRLPEQERADTPLHVQQLLAEPPWPGLSCPWDLLTPGAIASSGPGRRVSLIPETVGWESSHWEAAERDAALSWLDERLAFDFHTDPEHLGAVHLLLQDPNLSNVHVERVPDADPAFRMRVKPYFRGAPASGYTFTLYRQRPHAGEAAISFPLVGEQVIDLPATPFTVSTEVTHERRGLIWQEPPAVFLDGMSFEANLVLHSRRVDIEATGSRAPDSYSVPLVRDSETVDVSMGARSRTAAQVLSGNRARAEKRHPPYQRWFDGDAGAAAPAVRELIATTRRAAWIVDPYFDDVELRRFALAVGRTAAPIKVLTSAEGLRNNGKRGGSVPGARLLATALKAEASPFGQSSVEIRVMVGVRPEVHDRFLQVDDALWLLGSSLNEFGSRGTMLVAVPDPDVVFPKLEQAWEKAPLLADWVAARPVRVVNTWWSRWWRPRPRTKYLARLG
jgi:hypothetical protein